MKDSGKRKAKIAEIKYDLKKDPRYLELEKLEQEEKSAIGKRANFTKGQLDLFTEMFSSNRS